MVGMTSFSIALADKKSALVFSAHGAADGFHENIRLTLGRGAGEVSAARCGGPDVDIKNFRYVGERTSIPAVGEVNRGHLSHGRLLGNLEPMGIGKAVSIAEEESPSNKEKAKKSSRSDP